jgi:iron complex transport system permease protein
MRSTDHRNLTIRVSRGDISLRFDIRTLLAFAITLVLLALGVAATAAFGEIPFSLLDVVRAVFGHGSHLAQLIVREFRLPESLEAALIGGMLGLSGALFQKLVNNPLVAPDIIGVNEGAAVAAVAVIILGSNQNLLPLAAFGGGMAAAATGYLLSIRRGLSPYRLVLVGIAINALLGAAINFLLSFPVVQQGQRPKLQEAQDWLYGSVANALWSQVRLLAVAFAVLFPAALLLGRALDLLGLGEDTARSLSLRVGTVRFMVLLVGVLLAATAVSMAGPIGFVAFIAPHLARRMGRNSAAGSLALSAAVGAVLLLAADYVAKRILEPNELPVGIVTVALGAPYFLLLLYRTGRRGNVI